MLRPILFLILLFSVSCQAVTVDTPYGPVSGMTATVGDYSSEVFYGIPFAQAGRWENPREPTPWTSPFNATQWGLSCPQDCGLPSFVCSPYGMSETCLTANVYRPLNTSAFDSLPVMFWIYGGGYIDGVSGCELYEAVPPPALGDVIVVSINYRLGVFGFGVLEGSDVAGNYGMLDQIEGLKWTQKVISSFGGNPNQVTIYGESAGGMSVAALLLSPAAKGLFQAAILESDPLGLSYASSSTMDGMTKSVGRLVGCDVSKAPSELAACMRQASMEDLVKQQIKAIPLNPAIASLSGGLFQAGAPFSPVFNEKILPGNPLDLFPEGKFHRVPIIIGTNTLEGAAFTPAVFPVGPTPLVYGTLLKAIYGANSKEVRSMYPCSDKSECGLRLAQIVTDYLFTCPVRNVTRSFVTLAPSVYRYVYNYTWNDDVLSSPPTNPIVKACDTPGAVCHGLELPGVFGTLPLIEPYTTGEKQLSDMMIRFWTNFAQSLSSPNEPVKTSIRWPDIGSGDTSINFSMDTPGKLNIAPISNYREKFCNFWDSIGYTSGTYYSAEVIYHLTNGVDPQASRQAIDDILETIKS